MEIREVQNKEEWENFLGQCPERTFLQSWNWGEFQQKMGNKNWRLGLYDQVNNIEQLIAVALVSKIVAKRGTFLLVQHGPVSMGKPAIISGIFVSKLNEIAKQEKAIFIRMNPLWENNQENRDVLKKLGLKESPMHANAYEATWKLDLNPSEEELLRNMRKTTRYIIRQTQKNPDIAIQKSEELEYLETYQTLNNEVAKRQRFTPFSDYYIKNEYETFLADNQTSLFLGKYKSEVTCAAMVIFWSGIGFYHQAASLDKYAKLSIPYLVQWEAIKEAKSRGCSLYDFWGYTDPKKYPRHPWAGPTLFKMGFGGQACEYVETQDIPLSRKYWLTYFFEKMRKLQRRL
ncbi:MAG: peptidoglycan bridge formation glycyltransferase FemA/FemB family protein [bacterium]|nr:peptidoglycan bridge formation glycyltransferase FemA/FemB family protein [bacterium]